MGAGTPSTEGESRSRHQARREQRAELPPSPKGQLGSVAKGASLLIALAAVVRVIDALVNNPLSRAAFGAIAVSLVLGWVGSRSEGLGAAARRRATLAAGLVLVPLAAMVAAALVGGGQLYLVRPGLTVVFGAAESLATAYRDELWLHGLVLLYAARGGVRRPLAAVYAVLASAAVLALQPGLGAPGLLLALASTALFVLLWLRTGDAWAPVAAHAAWLWLTESLLSGELLDVVSPAGRVGAGTGASGAPAWAAAALFLALCVLVARGRVPLGPAALPRGDGVARARAPL